MTWWKKGFEIALWKTRLIVVLAVFPSIVAGVALFCIIAVESFRLLLDLAHYWIRGSGSTSEKHCSNKASYG
jgi:hypothetical protein